MSPGEGREPCWARRTRAIAVTCDQCYASTSCPDPWAARAITHHHCDPDPTIAAPEAHGPALDGDQPALHLLAGRWVASCPICHQVV